MANESVPEILQPQWFLPLFVAMWFGITGLFAWIGGWASLARLFPAQGDVLGERFRFASGSIGWRYLPVNYGNCLFITVNEEGMHLSIIFPFRFLSPPLFVPWANVSRVEERRLLFLKYYVSSIRDHWAHITLWGSPGRHVKQQFDAFQARGRSGKSPTRRSTHSPSASARASHELEFQPRRVVPCKGEPGARCAGDFVALSAAQTRQGLRAAVGAPNTHCWQSSWRYCCC